MKKSERIITKLSILPNLIVHILAILYVFQKFTGNKTYFYIFIAIVGISVIMNIILWIKSFMK